MQRLLISFALSLAWLGLAWGQAADPNTLPPERCAYNTSLPALTSGQAGFVQCDAYGRLIIANPGSGGGGGGSSGPVYGPDAQGALPTQPPILTGLLDAAGKVRAISPTNPVPISGSIGNTGFNALQAGAATSLTNPFFVQLSQGGAALSASNGLPTNDANIASTTSAPGTAAPKSQSVQGPDGTPLEKDATGQAIKTALGTPFQAGGSIGNTAFGINGPIPAGANIIGKVGLDPANNTMMQAGFAPTGQASLTATTTSSNVALGSAGPSTVITNSGTTTAYINFGTSNAVVATTANYPVLPGQTFAFSNGTNTFVAAITASGSDPLSITTGTGTPIIANAGGSSGGGGGATGSVGPAGTNGTQAQSVQGVNGGVALPVVQTDGVTYSLSSNGTSGAPLLGTGADASTGGILTNGMASALIQAGTGALFNAQVSNDNVTYFGETGCIASGSLGAQVTGNVSQGSAASALICPLHGKYIRFTSGNTTTYTATVVLKQTLAPQLSVAASQYGNWTVLPNATNGVGGISLMSRLNSSAATTNATLVKSSFGRVYKVYACNTTTTAKYIRLFNKATAPVPGTDTPFLSRALPPSATAGVPLCQSFDAADIGYYLGSGIGYDITGASPDNDTTATAAGDVTQVSVEYN